MTGLTLFGNIYGYFGFSCDRHEESVCIGSHTCLTANDTHEDQCDDGTHCVLQSVKMFTEMCRQWRVNHELQYGIFIFNNNLTKFNNI